MLNITSPQFNKSFFHPRYWLTWFGIGCLYLLVQLPYPFLFILGKRLGRISLLFLPRRKKIAKRNLELCFPMLTQSEIEEKITRNFESVGMGLIETGMAWFWSDKRIKKWCKVEGLAYMQQAVKEDKGILLIGLHFLTLELGGRILGMYNEGIGVYRPHNNLLMDWIQLRGRLKSNKAFIHRYDIKQMIHVLKKGEILWYAPDHDYGLKNSVFASFFAMPNAATTKGTSILMRRAQPLILPFSPIRNKDGSGYTVSISPVIASGFPYSDTKQAAEFMNRIIEKEILKNPDCYMWLHRRFKTQPEGMPPIY